MAESDTLGRLTDNLKEYIDTNFELIKLKITEKISVIGSGMASKLIIVISIMMFLLILFIGIAIYLSSLLGNAYSGYFIVAGFIFLITLILILAKKKLLESPIRDIIVREIMENEQ
jgi:hypothetical protein